MTDFTSQLLDSLPDELEAATRHPFLGAAGNGSLAFEATIEWLGQDRLYALSYIHFISTLLTRSTIPVASHPRFTLDWDITTMLIDCLTNIKREIELFESTALEWGFLDRICATTPSIATRSYQDLFAGACANNRSLFTGLVTLWATEECYLRAWSHAKQIMDGSKHSNTSVMHTVFIPNWSSSEFALFVAKLRGLVNRFAKSIEMTDTLREEAQIAWRQVLWAEKNFWPDV